MTLIDIYYKRPIFYDYTVGIVIALMFEILKHKNYITLPDGEKSITLISDLSTISLTLAGFILTFLTVIVTFKTAAKRPARRDHSDVSLFDLFFNTNLYFSTTRLLKGGIKSLVFISVIGLVLKMTLSKEYLKFFFHFNVIWITIIAGTMWRNLLILSKIIDLHKEVDEKN